MPGRPRRPASASASAASLFFPRVRATYEGRQSAARRRVRSERASNLNESRYFELTTLQFAMRIIRSFLSAALCIVLILDYIPAASFIVIFL